MPLCDTCKDTGREKETLGSIKFLCNEVMLPYFLSAACGGLHFHVTLCIT